MEDYHQLAAAFERGIWVEGKDPMEEVNRLLDELSQVTEAQDFGQEFRYAPLLKELIFLPNHEKRKALYQLIRAVHSNRREIAGQFQDNEFVTEFMVGICKSILGNCTSPVSIADITSGVGSTLGRLYEELEPGRAISFELVESNVNIQRKILRLTSSNVDVSQRNVVTEGVPEINVDLVASTFPLGGRVIDSEFGSVGNLFSKDIRTRDVEPILLDRALRVVKRGGYVVVLLGSSFLFKSGTGQLVRNAVMDQAIVKAIISLPGNALQPYSGASTCMLVLQKKEADMPEPATVTMVDMSHVILDRKHPGSPLDIEEYRDLLTILSSNKEAE